jgi:hypothetical protein
MPTLSIMTLSKMIVKMRTFFIMTLKPSDTQHYDTQQNDSENENILHNDTQT